MKFPAELPTSETKSHWSVPDLFGSHDRPVVCFVHRDYRIGMHTHGFVEINVVRSGEGRHYMSGISFPTHAGDVFVVPPDTRHGYAGQAGHDVHHLILHPQFLNEHRLRLRALPGFLLLFTVEPHFRVETAFRYGLRLSPERLRAATSLLDEIEREVATGDRSSYLAMESMTLQLIAWLCRWYGEQHQDDATVALPRQMEALAAVFQLVGERYADKLTLDDLAGAARMERSHFSRLFRRVMGITPMEYLREQRIEVARRLLLQPDANVTEVAFAVGFYDAAHFSRTFSRLMGVSPRRFRSKLSSR